MLNKCPGQLRLASAQNIICVHCGYTAEIFSDEIRITCPQCRNLIFNQKLPTCLDWCRAAKECIGEEKYKQLKGGG